MKKEKIINIPNIISILRIILTFVIIYFILMNFSRISIAIMFIIAMITDALDGQIARRFKMKSEIGRKLDMIADRFLVIGVILFILMEHSITKSLTNYEFVQFLLIMTREIVAFPFAIIALASGNAFPKVRIIGKATTVLQGISFPMILLSSDYVIFSKISIFFSILTAISGLISGFKYIKDVSEKNDGRGRR
ncbi:MAG: CDP-alcohol phosphatidyltransferase family protein [Candidatus Pacearchaeota archaeon]|nr:CDP-alcohol phosphatidyltransferase family protein [Candidatus Pacearchaeota archaeon]